MKKEYDEFATAGIITSAGNSKDNYTSIYRRENKPDFNESTCINCLLCWVFCPDNSIVVENEKVVGINFDYCKGCGICANECPVLNEPKPLSFIPESENL